MKSKDFALIIVVVIVAGILSSVASKMFITAKKSGLTAETVEGVKANFPRQGSDEYKKAYGSIFNEQAINPTKLIRIGDTDPNLTPF